VTTPSTETLAGAEVERVLRDHGESGAAAVAYFSFQSPRSFVAARDADGTIALRRLLRDWNVEVVACAGDLFARNRFIAERARRGLLRPRLRVCFPDPEGSPCA
jgi:hypothetical protein